MSPPGLPDTTEDEAWRCTNVWETIFPSQQLLIILVVFATYLTDSSCNFSLWKKISQEWQLTLASQDAFHTFHTRYIHDNSSPMQLVILSAWLDILLMVFFFYNARPRCWTRLPSCGCRLPALGLASCRLLMILNSCWWRLTEWWGCWGGVGVYLCFCYYSHVVGGFKHISSLIAACVYFASLCQRL